MKPLNTYLILTFFVIFSSCLPTEIEEQKPETLNASANAIRVLENLPIPSNFNFETERKISITINDATPYVKYKIYAYSNESGVESENILKALNNLLYVGKPYNGVIRQVFSLPSIYEKVYISRKDGLEYSSEIINVLNNEIELNITANKSANSSKTVNSSCTECTDNFFLNSSFEEGPKLPNRFIITDESNLKGWSTSASDGKVEIWKSGFGGVPAQKGNYFVELNANVNSALYQRICTSPGAEISWSVWHRGRSGTDNAVVRIGEDLTTATIETVMNTGRTAWVQYSGTYTVPAGQEDTYFIFESLDSGSYGNFIDDITITETVAGTCVEPLTEVFYPTALTNATIVFEDQWPHTGDYDFNDLIINYNIKTTFNAQNSATQIDYNYTLESIGGNYTNGFGIELEGVLPAAIESVTGANLTEGIINNSPNGTEQSQPNAVIIFFDNSHTNVGINNTISIVFSSPVNVAELGTAPFNPFLIIDKDRLKEIHLPNKPTTYYPTTTTIESSPTVQDRNGNFKTMTGLPWAINITGEFRAPKEKVIITDVYNHFADWATSAGNDYTDWYQNIPGNINISKLKD